MRSYLNVLGNCFGKLIVFSLAGRNRSGQWRYNCLCDCGCVVSVFGYALTSGHTKSCGCLRKKHGMCNDPIYSVWEGMKGRCYTRSGGSFKYYGARNITVCAEWRNDFKTFYEWARANDWQPGLQIDRINNDGNYEPGNCRFVTPKENTNNRRTKCKSAV